MQLLCPRSKHPETHLAQETDEKQKVDLIDAMKHSCMFGGECWRGYPPHNVGQADYRPHFGGEVAPWSTPRTLGGGQPDQHHEHYEHP